MAAKVRIDFPEGSFLKNLSSTRQKEIIKEMQKISTPIARRELSKEWKGVVGVDTGALKKRTTALRPTSRQSRIGRTGFVIIRIRSKFWLYFQRRWPEMRAELVEKAPRIAREAFRAGLLKQGYRA